MAFTWCRMGKLSAVSEGGFGVGAVGKWTKGGTGEVRHSHTVVEQTDRGENIDQEASSS